MCSRSRDPRRGPDRWWGGLVSEDLAAADVDSSDRAGVAPAVVAEVEPAAEGDLTVDHDPPAVEVAPAVVAVDGDSGDGVRTDDDVEAHHDPVAGVVGVDLDQLIAPHATEVERGCRRAAVFSCQSRLSTVSEDTHGWPPRLNSPPAFAREISAVC